MVNLNQLQWATNMHANVNETFTLTSLKLAIVQKILENVLSYIHGKSKGVAITSL